MSAVAQLRAAPLIVEADDTTWRTLVVLCAYRVLNQAGDEVCTWKCMQLLAKRPGTYTIEV